MRKRVFGLYVLAAMIQRGARRSALRGEVCTLPLSTDPNAKNRAAPARAAGEKPNPGRVPA